MIATGSIPNLEDLNLQKADVQWTKEGIWVDEFLRTSNSKVWALGDVIGGGRYSRTAEYEANLVVSNTLTHFHKKRDCNSMPSVVFTSPELASTGLSEEQARLGGHAYETLRYDFHHNHLSIIEGRGRGRIKVILDSSGRLLGAQILGERASELIQEATLAMQNGLTAHDLVRSHRVYPSSGIAWNHLLQSWCAAHPSKHSFPFFK